MSGKGRTGLKNSKGVLNEEHTHVVKEGDLLPGDCVSTDQFEYRVKGSFPASRGKEDPQNMYSGGTVYVDHASSPIHVYNQA